MNSGVEDFGFGLVVVLGWFFLHLNLLFYVNSYFFVCLLLMVTQCLK